MTRRFIIKCHVCVINRIFVRYITYKNPGMKYFTIIFLLFMLVFQVHSVYSQEHKLYDPEKDAIAQIHEAVTPTTNE